MKKRITAILTALVMAVSLAACGTKTETGTDTSDEVKVTPTFMYFVSNSDPDFDATADMINKLKDEYKDKINFNVINIDENKEAANNFPVQDNTPALIMLNESNDISAIEFKCSDKSTLTDDIKAALGE